MAAVAFCVLVSGVIVDKSIAVMISSIEESIELVVIVWSVCSSISAPMSMYVEVIPVKLTTLSTISSRIDRVMTFRNKTKTCASDRFELVSNFT